MVCCVNNLFNKAHTRCTPFGLDPVAMQRAYHDAAYTTGFVSDHEHLGDVDTQHGWDLNARPAYDATPSRCCGGAVADVPQDSARRRWTLLRQLRPHLSPCHRCSYDLSGVAGSPRRPWFQPCIVLWRCVGAPAATSSACHPADVVDGESEGSLFLWLLHAPGVRQPPVPFQDRLTSDARRRRARRNQRGEPPTADATS